jgi:hypothetical protein
MHSYTSTVNERYSIWIAHNRRCFWCRSIVEFQNIHIDHLIPRAASSRLAELISKYSLPADFQIDGFRNVAPACHQCNLGKGSIVFEPSPILLVQFDTLARLESKAVDKLRQIETANARTELVVLLAHQKERGVDLERLWLEVKQEIANYISTEGLLDYPNKSCGTGLETESELELCEEEAVNLVLALLEVRQFGILLRCTKGAGKLGCHATCVGDSWCVQIFESKDTHVTTFGWYEVPADRLVRKLLIV